jgi:small subunit ribosomal protein S5
VSEENTTPVEFEERVVFVNRCAKVVKGGRRFSFSAVVVVGNRNGKVGCGFGKANEVPDAIRKGGEAARKAVVAITMKDRSIPHEVMGKFDGGNVMLKPASPGTGVIAGGGMRSVLEMSGIRDVLGKSLGSSNRLSVVKATFAALKKLRSEEEILASRKA